MKYTEMTRTDVENLKTYGPCEKCCGPREMVTRVHHDGDETTTVMTMRCTRCGHSD